MKNKPSRNPDWNLILTGISVLSAVLSVIVAISANRIATEANRVAFEAQLFKVSTQIAYLFPNFNTLIKQLCEDAKGNLTWNTDFLVVLDITNLGAKSASIVRVQQGEIETGNPSVRVSVSYDLFDSSSSLSTWILKNYVDFDRNLLGIGKLYTTTLDYSGLPLNAESGKTVRIALLATQHVFADKGLDSDQVLAAIYKASWISNIRFMLGDGSTQSVSIPLRTPSNWCTVENLDPRTGSCPIEINPCPP